MVYILQEVDLELGLEDWFGEVRNHRNGTDGFYGALNRVAKLEKETLGIKEWGD